MPEQLPLPAAEQAIYCSALLPVSSLDAELDAADGGPILVCGQPTPEAALIACDQARRLFDAINSLPPRQRAAIELVVHAELSQAKASRRLGITEAAVSKLVAKARNALRPMLDA